MIQFGENEIYKLAARYAGIIALVLVACHYFGAAPAVAIVCVGCGAAFANRVSIALSAFILLPFIMIFNPILIPKSGMLWGFTLRGGPLLIGLCLATTSQRRKGNYKLPLNMLWAYLLIAAMCSIQGYVPKISYAKLINFGLFLWVICEATKNLQTEKWELFRLRAFLFGLTALLIIGSLIAYRYPAVSTLNGLVLMKQNIGADVEFMDDFLRSAGGQKLFVGLLNQSQAFAGVASCCLGWLICDMLFVEQRIRGPHMVLICVTPVLVFMTRSRMGLLIMSAFVFFLYIYSMRRVGLPKVVKNRINGMLTVLLVLGSIALAVGEARNHLVSRWIRKTDAVANDERGLSEAITNSRQGLIDQNLSDFRRNRLFGSGFQVAANHVARYGSQRGFIITAPIEKGILPLMVLGETGILGALFFLLFLSDFFAKCAEMHLWSTLTLFAVLLASNMAEATFFSPGGIGAILWCFTAVGGFVCDSYVRSMQSNPIAMSRRYLPPKR